MNLSKLDSKVAAIRNFPKPFNRKEAYRLIGMVNYLSRIIRNLSVNVTILRRLIPEEVTWQWMEIEANEFNNVKSLIADIETLRYFLVTK